jgi:hypothetical protein
MRNFKKQRLPGETDVDIREILLTMAIVCVLKITRAEILKSDIESGVKKNLLNLLEINKNN